MEKQQNNTLKRLYALSEGGERVLKGFEGGKFT